MAIDIYSKLHYFLSRKFLRTPANHLILKTAVRNWPLILVSFSTSLVSALSEGATLGVIYLAVDVISSGSKDVTPLGLFTLPWSGTSLVIVLMLFAVFAQAMQSSMKYVNKVCVGFFSAKTGATITGLIHRQILGFSFPCASRFKVGELTNYAASGPAAVQIEIEAISDLCVGLIMSLTYIFVLLTISPWLLLIAIVLALAISLLQKFLEPRLRRGALRQASIAQSISARAVEDYQALRLLHTTGKLDYTDKKFQSLLSEMESANLRQTQKLALLDPITSFLPIVAVSLMVSLSLVLFEDRASNLLPSLVAFVIALQRLNARMGGMALSFNALANNAGLLQLTNEILETRDKQYRRTTGVDFTDKLNSIELTSVSLQYNDNADFALSDVSFRIHAGQTVALVGPSGAGKSSIADLLIGLYEPTFGQLTINNTLLSSIALPSWQKRLGVVSQDTFLFNASIADNLSFGLDDISLVDIKHSAALSQASGFIDKLPDGYNTLVGERGYKLSGGQRQRLSLARALLKRPELLILDEATSALDTESERLVQDAIQRLRGDCTVLVIAHRLSTIVNADQIIVLDQGKIIQAGTHSSLIKTDGLYHRLWLQQSSPTTQP
ncbi:ABC transporter ATP-binding protein [Synechococcus sp. MIT S9452]|uniref:ABC transporter ATP-binding protein n=1 Tax=Synechococcus sp. MIT S9452 TaxID=3082546 RepID=UPI0039A636FB